MLHTFISENRGAILSVASAKVAARDGPRATETGVGDGISQFLDELNETLKSPPSQGPSSHPRMEQDATLHGRALLMRGFTVSQVIHDYAAVCQSITSMAFACEMIGVGLLRPRVRTGIQMGIAQGSRSRRRSYACGTTDWRKTE